MSSMSLNLFASSLKVKFRHSSRTCAVTMWSIVIKEHRNKTVVYYFDVTALDSRYQACRKKPRFVYIYVKLFFVTLHYHYKRKVL